MNNLSYYLDWGLHLPFRFYTGREMISEASDYGREVIIPKTEYIIMQYGEILPFQIVRNYTTAAFSPVFTIYCVNQEEGVLVVSEMSDSSNYTVLRYEDDGDVQWITFKGIQDLDIPTGAYFATFEDGAGNKWYSDNFKIQDPTFDVTFRKWSSLNVDLRTDDGLNLRIV